MPVLRLTDTAIQRMRPPTSGRLEISDAVMTGLTLRVTPAGIKSWSLVYRFAGKQKRLSLGRYPVVDLKEAREQAHKALRQVSRQEDPIQSRKVEEAAIAEEEKAETIKEMGERFIERYAKIHNRRWKGTQQLFKNHIYPALGDRVAKELRRRDVVALLDKISGYERPHAANHVLAALRKMYNWGIERDELEFNPCSNIKKPVRTVERERVLTKEEIRHFWAAANKIGYPYGPLFKLLLLTGQRRSEIAELKWDHVFLEEKVIRLQAENVKAKRGHEVPLSDMALGVLKGLPRFKGPYIFTTTEGKRPVAGFGKMKNDFVKHFKAEDWRLHDLRRTCATGLAGLKVPIHTISRVLNHAEGGVTKIYARHSYLDEKREALELWAQKLIELLKEEDAKEKRQNTSRPSVVQEGVRDIQASALA